MALLAESLVEEWLNRRGFFTIRGVKKGHGEIDLLGVRRASKSVEAWHVKVQVSFNPINYFTRLTPALARQKGVAPGGIATRSPDELRECVEAWVEKKFRRRQSLRDSLWPGVTWNFVLVHGEVKHRAELSEVSACGVELVDLETVLDELTEDGAFAGSAGGALADIIRFYNKRKHQSDRPKAPVTMG